MDKSTSPVCHNATQKAYASAPHQRALSLRPLQSHDTPLVPQEGGTFSGYASLFGVADLSGDIIEPGAFQQSLKARGAAGVRLLWQHDPAQPLGIWQTLREDTRGLYVEGRLNPHVIKAREVEALLKEGAIEGLSIGFRVERARRDSHSGRRHITRVDLWEISLVTFPMLPQARVSRVKRSLLETPAPQEARLVQQLTSAAQRLLHVHTTRKG